MNETDSSRQPIGLWAMVTLALILSITSIALHITTVTDRRSNPFEGGSIEYQQLLNLHQQLKVEMARLQASISESSSFTQLKQSMKQTSQPWAPAPPSLPVQTDSPMAALMVLEQSRMRNSFDDYQKIHPIAQQKVLEQIYLTNRELKMAYEELSSLVAQRFAQNELPEALSEPDSERLTRLLFKDHHAYGLMETNKIGDTQAELKINLTVGDEQPGGTEGTSKKVEVKLKAVRDGANWKIADYPDALALHAKVLARMKQRLKECKSLVQQCNRGELKTWVEFLKAWEALP